MTNDDGSEVSAPLEKTYQPAGIEQRWYARWEAAGYFSPAGRGAPFCIMIPPPNVTGTLHMGHAFQHTLQDALTRHHRMRGDNTLWQPGTDHAGIATQMVVERQLNAAGQNRQTLGREAFLERVWQWKETSGGTISRQMRRLGNSVDWSRDRFTMDEGLSKAVTEVFVRLHREGLIYRGKRLVNWDPVLHTALSDLEVQSESEQGFLWHIRYPLADGSGVLVVATTRPETLLGDTAVAIHPEDARYQKYLGKTVRLPLTGRLVPVLGDNYVDPAFGSGCVKVTPGHDFADYEVGKRHQLPLINILDRHAHIISQPDAGNSGYDPATALAEIPAELRGLERYEARRRIVALLAAQDLLERVEPHVLQVPRGDRSGAVLEPWLTDQWYVQVAPLAGPAIAAVADGRIRFVPENWSKTYFQWMHNLQDWCISRQLWWGHRIPAWYDAEGRVYVGRSEAEIRANQGLGTEVVLTQDEDVLDTWFSSALWPFSTLGWPDETAALKTFYPTSVLVTGFDIIFFWVARMIMLGMKFAGDVPFREVYITGLIRDENGDKMSKSKGNIVDPLDIIDGIDLASLIAKRTTGLMQPHLQPKIEKSTRKQFPNGIPDYGTDALRFSFAALASTGRDIRFDLNRVEGYRNFCNKIWNAARFVLLNVTGRELAQGPATLTNLNLPDRWILSRLSKMTEAVAGHFDTYRFDLAARALYEFIWNDYCDWYLELTKPILQDPTTPTAEQAATRRTLVTVLEALLRASHPFMPFITEEIWQRVAPLAGVCGESIMLQSWPDGACLPLDREAEDEMAWVQGFILAVRQIRGEMDIPPGKRIPLLLQDPTEQDARLLSRHARYLQELARLSRLETLAPLAESPPSATALMGNLKLLVPIADLIDVAAERARLSRNRNKAAADLARVEAKLGTESFTSHAPAPVVEKERERQADLRRDLAKLDAQLAQLATL